MELDEINKISRQLLSIEAKMAKEVSARMDSLKMLDPKQFEAGKNLIEYLVLRNEDIRNLQEDLHIHGLSSLASSESQIHRQLQTILKRLGQTYPEEALDICTYKFTKKRMVEKRRSLFGPKKLDVIPSLMVTFDISFLDDFNLIISLLQNGMNVARINCAHDDEGVWLKMIAKLKKACEKTGLPCKIYMDLAGPKIRTKLLGKGKDIGSVQVKEGKLIWLKELEGGFKKDDVVISPSVDGIISSLQVGERVYIDDGIIKGIVEKLKPDKVGIRITRISSKKSQIKEEKGINFPDTQLKIPSLTEYDRACLTFICSHADMVGYSFVKTPEDISELNRALASITENPPHIILKIETHEAVKNLPFLLLEGMKHKEFGVMIARGDLAVEIGFERMSEIQEEILWICEAAHVPVVWATQVLENLNKSGIATRSEVTDVVHSAQADCVMINKGEHTVKVLEMLIDILTRTATHRNKKRYTFRPLKIAERFLSTELL